RRLNGSQGTEINRLIVNDNFCYFSDVYRRAGRLANQVTECPLGPSACAICQQPRSFVIPGRPAVSSHAEPGIQCLSEHGAKTLDSWLRPQTARAAPE
ncbi:MAG: hypothetical protein ACRD22_19625, partial [Terriglobia bacterium]